MSTQATPSPRRSHHAIKDLPPNPISTFWDAYYATATQGDSPLTDAPSSFIHFCTPHMMMLPAKTSSRKVVEFGCGNGRDARWFAARGFSYIGLDASPAAVDRCMADIATKTCTFQTGDFAAPDLLTSETGTVDLVYSRFTLHSVTEEQEAGAIANAYRLLKPGGRFMLEARSTRDPRCGRGQCVGGTAYIDTHYRRFLDLDATIAACEAAGFEVRVACEEVRAANFLADKAVVVRVVGVKPGVEALQEVSAMGQAGQQPLEPQEGVIDEDGSENVSPRRARGA